MWPTHIPENDLGLQPSDRGSHMSQESSPLESSYIHGSTPIEQQRLALLNDLMNGASLHELALLGEESVLDVGSGLGQLTVAMARVVGPGARVVGVERDPRQLAEAIRRARSQGENGHMDLREGDALALPLCPEEWGTFDVAHARFLLEHVADPLAVVQGMVRAVRPGGRVVLEDDDHAVIRLWPEPAGFATIWQAYVRTYDRLGNDPYIGRRLVALLHEAGAVPSRNTWIFFGGCSGQPTFEALAHNMLAILEGVRATLLAQSLVDAETFDTGIAGIRTWMHRPDAALWFSICWAEGVRPPERIEIHRTLL
jgi:SAM-dependent methyltransferase